MKALEQIIAEHPFLEGLSPQYFRLLHEGASARRFGAQQQIFQEGSPADQFYLIHAGRVALQTFAPGTGFITIQTIGAGEALGWSWLFPPYRWHFSARSVEATGTVALDARVLRERAEQNADFGREIAMRVGRVMLQRLQATRMQLLDFYAAPA